MPVQLIRGNQRLADPEQSDPRGIVAVGGDLRAERLIDAYRRGIFPWYEEGLPILWHSPDPRFVLRLTKPNRRSESERPAGPLAERVGREAAEIGLNVGRSLRKTIRRGLYRVSLDTAFGRVIRQCAKVPRPGQDGTWITNEMIEAFERLYSLGHAHSVEAWSGHELVGGVYGVAVGAVFCGESMFALAPDASKVAFVALAEQLARWGFELIDCQVYTDHLARFGAVNWPRRQFLKELERLRDREVGPGLGRWTFDASPERGSDETST